MDPASKPNYLNLRDTAQKLGVNKETLILWNENNILKPTITLSGEVGYREEQISQFMAIRQMTDNAPVKPEPEKIAEVKKNGGRMVWPAFGMSFFTTIVLSFLLISKYSNNGKQNQMLVPSVSGELSSEAVNNKPSGSNWGNTIYAETGSKTNQSSVFDNSGNLKGSDQDSNVLAAAINYSGLIPKDELAIQNSDPNILIALLIPGSILIYFLLKKQPNYSTLARDAAAVIRPTTYQTVSDEPKIIEVLQKTDGTVVLDFEGQEYKVCKPELDSESDQFIVRLMELVVPGMKEIDYDITCDDRIKLTAPLSKIVTRLGFVGIKRDLFFPRTSKNRVLFRKFVTQKDLEAIDLNTNEIKSGILTA